MISVSGADLHYVTRGTGPVCLVPCSMGTASQELMLPSELDASFQLVFLDLRGSGRSSGDPGELTYEQAALDFEAVRLSLGAERVVVLGHSILGALAVEYAVRRPESVSHVITAGTPPSGNMLALGSRAAEYFELCAEPERKAQLRDNLAKIPAGAPPGLAMLAQTPQRFFDYHFDAAPLFARAEVKPAFFAHLLGKLGPAWNAAEVGKSLSVPWLITHGRHDYVVPHTLWEGVLEELPQASFVLFDQSGHQPFFEEPARFREVVRAWMQRET